MLIIPIHVLHLWDVNLSYWNFPIDVFTPRTSTLSKRIFLLAGILVFNSKIRKSSKRIKGVLGVALNCRTEVTRDRESTIVSFSGQIKDKRQFILNVALAECGSVIRILIWVVHTITRELRVG